MNQFKRGDKVKCITHTYQGDHVNWGSILTVRAIYPLPAMDKIGVAFEECNGYYDSVSFEPYNRFIKEVRKAADDETSN